MAIAPKDRIEIILMADQPQPVRLWIQSSGALARRLEYDREKSRRILGGLAALLFLAMILMPATIVLLFLMGLIIIFPMALVGMAGYSRGRSS